jgi:hypothetical protein
MAILSGTQAGEIFNGLGPALQNVMPYFWGGLIFLLFVGGLYYAFLILSFKIKINIREVAKGNRVICSTTRGKVYLERGTNLHKLKFFGKFGFGGEIINMPPSECLVPYSGRGGLSKLYDLVKKDGIYYPVQNFVLGILHEVTDKETGQTHQVYSIEGSGLELSRDFDSEESILNKMKQVIRDYNNEDKTWKYATLSLYIIIIIGSIVVMVIGLVKHAQGSVAWADALRGLKEPIIQATQPIIESRTGPG